MQQTGDRTDLRDFRNMEMAIETPYAFVSTVSISIKYELVGDVTD